MTVVTHYKTEYDTSLNKTFQCIQQQKEKQNKTHNHIPDIYALQTNWQVARKKKLQWSRRNYVNKAQSQNNHSPTQPPTTIIHKWYIELVNETKVCTTTERLSQQKKKNLKYFHQRLQTYTHSEKRRLRCNTLRNKISL